MHLELKKGYWGRHFWAKGYCVSTVGLDEQTIIWRNADVEQERRVAIYDLIAEVADLSRAQVADAIAKAAAA